MSQNRLGRSARAAGEVQPGLDGQGHARLEHAPVAADLVVADVVHVHAEPVTGPVHVVLRVGAFLDERVEAALEQAELDQPLGEDAHRGLVRIVPVIAGNDALDGRLLRLEHDLVDLALHVRRELGR